MAAIGLVFPCNYHVCALLYFNQSVHEYLNVKAVIVLNYLLILYFWFPKEKYGSVAENRHCYEKQKGKMPVFNTTGRKYQCFCCYMCELIKLVASLSCSEWLIKKKCKYDKSYINYGFSCIGDEK